MRGLEAILGGLLLASSVLASPGLLPTAGEPTEPIRGEATFRSANITGPTQVEAEQAVLRATSSFQASAQADDVTITVFHARETSVGFEAGTDPNVGGEQRLRPVQTWSREAFGQASIQIRAHGDGLLRAWPNASLGGGMLRLDVAPEPGLETNTSPVGVDYIQGDQWYAYQLDGPVFGLGHGTDSYHMVNASRTPFEQATARGALNVLVDEAEITVDHQNGSATYGTFDAWETRGPGGATRVENRTYAVVSLAGASLSMPFDDKVQSTFFAHEPRWEIDGSVAFQAREGQLEANGTTHELDDRTVRVQGPVNLTTRAVPQEGGPASEPIDHYRVFGAMQGQPLVESGLTSHSSRASIDGEAISVGPPASAPEQITLWGKIVGLALLAWAVSKKHLVFVATLLNGDPLENDRRQRIHAFLQETGMAHVRELRRALGIPVGSLSYHLGVLEAEGLVTSVERAGSRTYFPVATDLDEKQRAKLALLSHPNRRAIVRDLVTEGPRDQAALTEALEVSRSTVSRQLVKLVDAGLVVRQGQRNAVYEPSEFLASWISSLEEPHLLNG